MIENTAMVVEGIAWCLSEYVQMPLGQRIVGASVAAILLMSAFYFSTSSSSSKARALQCMIAVLSACSMAISLTMGHHMPEMEFLFFWMPLAGWLAVAAAYAFNKAIYFAAYKPVAFPQKLQQKARLLARKMGIGSNVQVAVFDSGKLEILSSSGRSNVILVSMGALEALSRKQLEAVLFHEMVHLQKQDSLWKCVLTAGLLSVFAPAALALKQLVCAHQEAHADSLTEAAYPTHFHNAQKAFAQANNTRA